MPYYPMTLTRFIKDIHTIEQSKLIFYFICRGLSAAHSYNVGSIRDGISHRDLKPANILIDILTWIPVIADWGMSSDNNKESTGGTFSYMPPHIK